jgi:hypothetical protein
MQPVYVVGFLSTLSTVIDSNTEYGRCQNMPDMSLTLILKSDMVSESTFACLSFTSKLVAVEQVLRACNDRPIVFQCFNVCRLASPLIDQFRLP